MALSEGAANTLWTALWKINAANKGYQFKVNIAGVDEATAVANADDLAARILALFPEDAEVMFATLSNNNSARDAAFLRNALGSGEYITAVGPPPVGAKFNDGSTGIQIRMETPDRQSVQRIFNPLPDTVVTDALIQGSVADVLSLPVAVDAPGAAATWYVEMANFMKALVMKTHYVKSGHAPGGVYLYSAWRRAFLIRVTKKKGGRAFI